MRILSGLSMYFREPLRSSPLSRMLSTSASRSPIAQGIRGQATLIFGRFAYFTQHEALTIRNELTANKKVLVIVFDHDSITVPTNERIRWILSHFNHHPELEVRAAYAPPHEKKFDKDFYSPYLKRQIPAHIDVTSIHCSSPLGNDHQQSLDNDDIFSSTLEKSYLQEEAIKADMPQFVDVFYPQIYQRVFRPFSRCLDEQAFINLSSFEQSMTKLDIVRLNPSAGSDHGLTRTRWDTRKLNQVNWPLHIGNISSIEGRKRFSNPSNAQVFDMPIYMPGQGWKIPTELTPYAPVITRVLAAETLANKSVEDCKVYITVDSGIVPPKGFARREGLHVDGFLNKENRRPGKDGVVWSDNTYIVSDSDELQTECYPGPFDLSNVNVENPQDVLQAFAEQGKFMKYRQYGAYDIIRLTTNNVHAVHENTTGKNVERTFVKLTFSERSFNRSGNTVNPLLNYRFFYVAREAGRNTQNYIGKTLRNYKRVDLREIDFANNKFPLWTSGLAFTARKKPNVTITAQPAVEGETLTTMVNSDVITSNIAKLGDIKVTRTPQDSYFLDSNTFTSLYAKFFNNAYKPTPRTVRVITLTENVSFEAPWGTIQNIPKFGYIVQNEKGEMWGVHEGSFDATYEAVTVEDSMSPSLNR